MKTIFVGHFSSFCQSLKGASSTAGNQVQRQIMKELSLKCGAENVISYSMMPLPSWPRGPIISRSLIEESVKFLGYLNLPVLKHVVFAFRLFGRLMTKRPQLCLQYNSYFFENVSLLLYRLCRPDCVLSIFIQDIHVNPLARILSKPGLRSLSERSSICLARRFNMILPISEAIVNDFRMDHNKCEIFTGGLTDFALKLMQESERQTLVNIGVFAGALEPHNGIDRLIDQWIACGVQWPLHVFGRGSLSGYVRQASERSKKIIFHDFQPEHIILEWQSKARWNFCLRYSDGLNQTYFFPSKLFNIACAAGAVMVNDFHGLPGALRDHLCILADDLSDLPTQLAMSADLTRYENVGIRHEIIKEEYSWEKCIAKIVGTQPEP